MLNKRNTYLRIQKAINKWMNIEWMHELKEFRIRDYNWLDYFCYSPVTDKVNTEWNLIRWDEIHMPLQVIYKKALEYLNKIEERVEVLPNI